MHCARARDGATSARIAHTDPRHVLLNWPVTLPPPSSFIQCAWRDEMPHPPTMADCDLPLSELPQPDEDWPQPSHGMLSSLC
jgi:hypothetical protein